MTTKLIIPVVNTENGEFKYNGKELTREEYGNMEYEQFKKTNSRVSRFVDNMARGISNFSQYDRRMRNVKDENHPDLIFDDEQAEVIISGTGGKEIDENTLISYAESGKMFILILNINPDTISLNAESEMRFWMRDSNKVINDRQLPDDIKIKSLLGRDYGIVAGDKIIRILNCKMVQDYSNKKNPFNFAIIVEKSYIE